MNPGPIEEAGKVANSFIDSLKAQPLALALVVMNIMLLAYLFYNEQKYIDSRKDFAGHLFAFQTQQSELLAKCIPIDEMRKLMEHLQGKAPP